jgi:hypothetical protein
MTEGDYYARAEAAVLGSLSGARSAAAAPYLRRIVDEWLGEADEDDGLDRDDLFDIGLADLQEDLEGKEGDDLVAALQVAALKPEVQQTSGRAFELATAVADGRTTREAASSEAQDLHDRILALMAQVRELEDEEGARLLMRSLSDGRMEMRYVLEEREGAISLRLNRHINR